VRPDHLECDYSISFDFNEFKNFRLPLFRWSPSLHTLYDRNSPKQIFDSKSKFCCMVVSNGKGKERNEFFKKLNSYKKVDSGGAHLNNIGFNVSDKVLFAKEYKFIIAFENSCFPGYTTEKIFQPMLVDCLPIYWGNPLIQMDFNTKSFINVHDFNNYDEVVNEIIRLDNDNQAYCDLLNQPFFIGNRMPASLEFNYLSTKFNDVICSFENSPPVSSYTYNRFYQFAHS
jgi:hypothetical protein